MGYIDQSLSAGEQVVYRANVHWWVFVRPLAILFLGFVWYALAASFDSSGPRLLAVLLLIGGIAAGVTSVVQYLTTELAVTTRRVIGKTGFISRLSIELMLPRVEGVRVEQGIIGRILDFGTLTISGTGTTHTPFHAISRPLLCRSSIQDQTSLE